MSCRPLLLLLWFAILPVAAQNPSSWGLPSDPVALTNATLMLEPGHTVSRGTLVVADGRVVAAGAEVAIPPQARRLDMTGKTIHAGFLDPYVVESRLTGAPRTSFEKPRLADRLRDEWCVADGLQLPAEAFDGYRALGFTTVALVPEQGIARGQSAVYHTAPSPQPARENLVQRGTASVIGFEPLGWEKLDNENYPLSLMGNVALVRQLFHSAAWYQSAAPAQASFAATLDSLHQVRSGQRLLMSEALSALDSYRWMRLADELAIPRHALVLSGQEWRTLDWMTSGERGLILPLVYPATPKERSGRPAHAWSLDSLREWHAAPGLAGWLAARGTPLSLTTHRQPRLQDWPASLQDALAAGLSETAALQALTVEPARLLGLQDRLGRLRPGMAANLVIRDGSPFEPQSQVREVWVEGRRFPQFRGASEESPAPPVAARPFIQRRDYRTPPSPFAALPTWAPGRLLVRGATLWSMEPGQAPQVADMLVVNGKIAAIGPNLPESQAASLDGRGLHLTPGLIDAHSHSAIEGDVNEPGRSVTAMVRIRDVLNPLDHDIYLQLASGVTTAHLLHGSANPIGGQSVTVKWRLGSPPEDLVVDGAPEGIKFALGENPKQSNWGDAHVHRYPQSRLGVQEVIRHAFSSAKTYRRWREQGLPVEPDLSLEALLEVLDGRRAVHCHSYRQDEILALLRLAEAEGFRIDVLQHVLEGYKIADEIAAHGASASTFADWWAYKVEVDDAIPHNAALMHQRGVLASINSDSPDLARRLNTEAAKSVRYGSLSELEALALVTRNPAEQLGLGHRLGTLEVGKDADFVLWSAPPLTQQAVCLETWVDGRRLYQRSAESERVRRLQAERDRLWKLAQTAKEASR